MEITATIPGGPIRRKKVGYNFPADVADDLANLRRTHRVNLSEFVAAAARDALRRHSRRKQSGPAA